MKLVIAEKPSVGSTIASVVGANTRKDGFIEGNGYIVSWCFGHLIGLQDPDYYLSGENTYWNIEDLPIIPDNWKFKLGDNSGIKKQYKTLKTLMSRSDVDSIVCATDAGREGECIFRYVYNYAKCSKKVLRLWVSSLEESAIKEGMLNLKDDAEYDNLYESGLARAKADWLIGMNLTRGYSIKYNAYKPILSIGRVQTPTLAMIVDRYNAFNNFVVETFYKIDLRTNKGFVAISKDKYTKEEGLAEIERINASGVVIAYDEKEQNKPSPKLFDLTLLQRTANAMYGYTAKETLDIAQKLYENKLITYPRTDSNYITDDMLNTVRELLTHLTNMKEFEVVKDYISNLNVKKLINNKKVSDHHALLPTKTLNSLKYNELSTKEKNILELICGRLFVASAPKRSYLSIKAIINVNNKEYEAKGTKIIDNGFKEVEKALGLVKSEEKELNIPQLTVGESIEILNTELSEHQTNPPKLFTDDTLLKAMEIAGNDDYEEGSDVEKKGIGTPATRASILETLVLRDYIKRENKKLIPTKRGINLINIVPEPVKSAKITALWETELQGIEKGKVDKSIFLSKIELLTQKLVEDVKGSEVQNDNANFKKEYPVIGICPFCKSDYIEYNKVFKCSNNECGSFIYKTMSSKKITKTIVKKLLASGRAEKVEGFISRSGKEFSADLYFNEEKKCAFDFK